MKETLINYHMSSTVLKDKFKVVGLSDEQLGAFFYESGKNKALMSIHISHFLVGDYKLVYNNSYILSNEEVIYLLKDIGGQYD